METQTHKHKKKFHFHDGVSSLKNRTSLVNMLIEEVHRSIILHPPFPPLTFFILSFSFAIRTIQNNFNWW